MFKSTKAVRKAPPPIGRAGARLFAMLAKKTKYAEPNLAEQWPALAGAEIARLCRPGRITGGRAAKTLEVHTPSSAAAAEVQMHADQLIARINRYLGPGAVARISIIQNASKTPLREVERDKTDPDDPKSGDTGRLGEALAAFRQAVARKNAPDR